MPMFGLGKNKKNREPAQTPAPARPEPALDLPPARSLEDNGDPAQGPLLELAAARDWPALRAALTVYAGHDLTSLTNTVLSQAPGIEEWLPDTLAQTPDDAFARAVLGVHTVNAAWKVRSAKRAQHVTQDQFKQFHAILREAEDHLYAAVELDPSSVVPWHSLMNSGRGLEVGREIVQQRFEAAIRRSPGHLGVHLSMLQQLCQKWSGSHELMHEFATEAARGPHADMLCVLVPQAYYEHFSETERETPERKFIQSAESRAELKELAERTIFRADYKPNPRSPYAAANMFGWAFAYAGLWPEAKAAYAASEGVCVRWAYFGKPVAEYDRLRTLAYRNG
ncbi:DUF4034 domain-containing protein [Actinospica robiniae]|uniref:DUF4034 domain-containing protein n=1 Tax=Actinospica robiniae TaxID=304901 RepID=UPI0004177454